MQAVSAVRAVPLKSCLPEGRPKRPVGTVQEAQRARTEANCGGCGDTATPVLAVARPVPGCLRARGSRGTRSSKSCFCAEFTSIEVAFSPLGTRVAQGPLPMEARSEQEMQAIMTPCDACGRDAVIHKVRYKYSVDKPPGESTERHTLRETHRDIECPQCGMRTQVEVHDGRV
jgi:hypothetical protein